MNTITMVASWTSALFAAMTPLAAGLHRTAGAGGRIDLPRPKTRGGMAVTRAMATRRSHREFLDQTLPAASIAQLCWAAQGVTDTREGLRAAPSAGALHPMTLLVVDAAGVYEYEPAQHALRPVLGGDIRAGLQHAALNQSCVGHAPACMVIVMQVRRSAVKYGPWAERYCLMEAGHIAQNVLLQATALGLAGVPVGAFDTDEVTALLELTKGLEPVYLVPLGVPG